MPINRSPITTKKTVEVLTDPNPVFLSLVDHGANQTPFSAFKSDTPPVQIGLGTSQQPAMKKKTSPAKETKTDDTPAPALVTLDSGIATVTKGCEIHRMDFAATVFKAETDVAKFLTANGYTDFEIVANGDAGFYIEGVAAESFETVEKIELPNGVTFQVGKLKNDAPEEPPADAGAADAGAGDASTGDASTGDAGADAGPTDPTPSQEPAAKGDVVPLLVSKGGVSLVSKFDTWNASIGMSLKDLMAQAISDGIPAGFYGIMELFQTAFANTVRTGNIAAIPMLTAELGDVLSRLANLFTTVAKTDAVGAESLLSLSAPPVQVSAAKSDGLTLADVEAAVNTATAALQAKFDEALATTIANATKELATKSELTSATAPISEAVSRHDGRLARVERVRQVRKSDDVVTAPPAAAPAAQKPISKSDANLFGIRAQSARQ